MSRIRRLLRRGFAFVEETITRIGDPYSGTALLEGMRKSRERASELALDNARLRDELDVMTERMNRLMESQVGPNLFKDETGAIAYAIGAIQTHGPREASVLENLLKRCNENKMTHEQWEEAVHAVIMGRTFDPELSPSDDIERLEHEPAYCDCNDTFRTPEDWWDHMNPIGPCDGVKKR